MRQDLIENYRKAQDIARETMLALHETIKVSMSEAQIYQHAIDLMTQKGSTSWWYHDVGALVLLGQRSVESLSGTHYQPSDQNLVSELDVITIDLAPTLDGYWGDYARTIFVEDGAVVMDEQPKHQEFQLGLSAELAMHQKMMEIVEPDMTFEALYRRLNAEISAQGFENLDFHGNLGHSIAFDQADRIYIEEGNLVTFAECGRPFTFEPHIKWVGGQYGFKREDIYYFDEDGILQRL
jgi:Xaa-Pro aminopeptidase